MITTGDGSDDYVQASGGHDSIIGGAGSDLIQVGGTHNFVQAGPGDAVLYGGQGGDTLLGGAGNDVIHAGSGSEFLAGGAGNNTLYAGGGADTMMGGPGDNTFAFGNGGGKNLVLDFHDGDVLQIARNINGLKITTPQDLLTHVTDDHGNAVITLGHETITLVNVKAEDIHTNPSGFFTIH
ncbi:MAG: hypothetical protein JO157_04045 [Acetobacteraceae bacterium]|nr:hypothetical protein [Acetobacteraceae bacterium]